MGPVIGAFLSGLRDKRLMGARSPDGRVLVPAVEYDPDTGAPVSPDLVEVGPEGVVESWTWVSHPEASHLLDRPFAFALIKPDGADTAMVHLVDAVTIDEMATGMRVVPRWREERRGFIGDIECWEPAS